MPQASDEDRAAMVRRFGSIDTEGPENFLKRAGYTLSPRWLWSKPGVTGYGQMTRDEFDCLKFLMHEWDYGGLEDRVSEFLRWATQCFGDKATNVRERSYRFTEEAIELAQAAGSTEDDVLALVRRVYKKPAGNLFKEASQCALLLEAVCRAANFSAPAEIAEIEWKRVQTISTEDWQARHAAKIEEGIAE